MNIAIYTKDNCNWCVKAKRLMNDLGMKYTEFKLGVDFTKEELREKKNMAEWERLFLPQIFIGEKCIGGYEELYEYCEATGMVGPET